MTRPAPDLAAANRRPVEGEGGAAVSVPTISCSCGTSWVGFDNRRLLLHLRDHLALQHADNAAADRENRTGEGNRDE